jgi:ring-1,2-phenylacetyl-CoA epoxidase subunit PaaB
MNDTQWPRFEVFVQEKAGKPHQGVGSVHAPDAEMALLNARDVFARRPDSVSMWVVPESEMFGKTAEELENNPPLSVSNEQSKSEMYYVFQKQTNRNVMIYSIHVGEVEARSPEEALQLAIQLFTERKVYAWWVCPSRAITRSTADDVDSLFAPALTKTYRQPNEYHTVTAMRKAKEIRD